MGRPHRRLRSPRPSFPGSGLRTETPRGSVPGRRRVCPGRALFTCDWSPRACRFLFVSHQRCRSTGTQFHSPSKPFTLKTSQTSELSLKAGDPFPRTPRRRYPQVEVLATAGTMGDSAHAPVMRHRSRPLVTSEAHPLGRFPRIASGTNYLC